MKSSTTKLIASVLVAVILLEPAFLLAATNTRLSYNARNQLQSVTLPQEQRHTYGYNQAGEVVSYTLPNSKTITYGREGSGDLSSVTDTRGLTTSYGSTLLGTLDSVISPDTGTTSRTYDGQGNLATKTDSRGTTEYLWDKLDRLTKIKYADAQVTFTYDYPAMGYLNSVQDASGSQGFSYDNAGNVVYRTSTILDPRGSPKSFGVWTTFDVAGRISELKYPSGKRVTYTYDGANVATVSVDGTQILSNIAYQPFGGPSGWDQGSSGARYTRTFDTAGHMKSYSFDGGTRTLTWDESNRLKSVTNPDGSLWSYNYDTLNRLVSASETTIGNREFTWDTSGNRTSAKVAGTNYAYGVDAGSNRLATSTAPNYAASYQYDAAGQMLSDGNRTFTWNAAGQLASLTGAQGATSYAYNGFGQRVRKTTGPKSRFFVYAEDGTSILGEYWQGAPGTPVGNVYEIVYLEGIPVAVLSGGQVYYVQTDQLSTPRVIKNAAGGVVWRWDSDPFGGGLANSNPSGLMQFEFNVRFPGQIYDTESGLHYNNARYYDTITGRYISSDPIGLAGGINTYGYVMGNPNSFSDRQGHNADAPGTEFIIQPSPTRQDGLPHGAGCGSADYDYWVPDNWGAYNFMPACRQHDSCYGTCGTPKKTCDTQFRDALLEQCNKSKGGFACQLIAIGYYGAMSFKASYNAYKNAQETSCSCSK